MLDNDNVYLCVKEEKDYCYKCFIFDTFKNADIYYLQNYTALNSTSSTLIPICKYVPFIFHNTIINYKLSKMFIKSEIIATN
jgi:hypothetical protein